MSQTNSNQTNSNPINQINKIYERPWGTYRTLDIGPNFQVKLIHIIPGGRLSLQSHIHREEHWVITQGYVTVTLNNTQTVYSPSQHIFIPKQAIHRLENLSQSPVELIEVQLGDYLGEDDIKRYEDIYGRLENKKI